jgi:N-acyl amino acid synthase FeeM
LKESIRKLLGKLRRDEVQGPPAPTKRRHHHRRRSRKTPRRQGPDITGQTVFHDRPLRFRSLTLTEPDLQALEHPSDILGAFKIRVAKRSGAHHDAHLLVQEKYVGRGYTLPLAAPQPRVSTFIAYDEGRVVGTVGLGTDSERGLSADELYREEIDRLRAAGCRICEFTRLAVDRTAASKSVLAGLFHTAYLYASKIGGYTHAVIEVNPRHVAFYGRELKFEPIGPERLNTRVNAPAVLLCVSFETIAQGLAKYAGKSPLLKAKRTLFHYGFPPEAERGVLKRLYELVAAGARYRSDCPRRSCARADTRLRRAAMVLSRVSPTAASV